MTRIGRLFQVGVIALIFACVSIDAIGLEDVAELYKKGFDLQHAGKLEQARKHASGASHLPRADELVQELAELNEEISRTTQQESENTENKARQSLQTGNFDEATQYYMQALDGAQSSGASKEEQAELVYGAGIALYRAGRYHQAREKFEQAILLVPEDARWVLQI